MGKYEQMNDPTSKWWYPGSPEAALAKRWQALQQQLEQPKTVPVPADPWAHRSSGMRCKTCMWFAPKAPTPTSDDPLAQRGIDLGRCRRHAPTMNGYPVVFVNDWCGDHKLNENAL